MSGQPCAFCGFVFDQDKLGRYGCPNCEGSPIAGVTADAVPRRVGWFVFTDDEWRQSTKCAEGAIPLYELPPGVNPCDGAEAPSSLQLTIRQDPDSGWWIIAGPAESGVYIANPSLDLCVADILPTWRTLAEVSPTQVPPIPPGVKASQAPSNAHVGPPDWLRLAQECGGTVYRHRSDPKAPGVAFGDESWARFTAALSAIVAAGVMAAETQQEKP